MNSKKEIDVNSYLNNFANREKKYKKDDLKSNQYWFARLLQYVYVCGVNQDDYQELIKRYNNLFKDYNALKQELENKKKEEEN